MRARVLAIAAVVLFAVAAVMTAVAAQRNSELAELRRDEREVRQTAIALTEAVFEFDYRDVDATRRRVSALTADPYRERFETSFPSFEDQIVEQQATGSVEIIEVFTSTIEDGAAEVILVISIDTTLAGAPDEEQPTRLPREYLRLSLNRGDSGDWKVVDFITLQLTPLNQR